MFMKFRELVSVIDEGAYISLDDGIGLIEGVPQLDDSGADVDMGCDSLSIRLLTAARISSRDALLRIKPSSCVD